MQVIDGTTIGTSLPAMAADFGTDSVSLNIGLTDYLLAMAVCIPPAGCIPDRFGPRDVFLCADVVDVLSDLFISTACQRTYGPTTSYVGKQR